MNFPPWTKWEIEITPHVEKRMLQRNFNEIDLRSMIFNAQKIKNDIIDGRYVLETKLFNQKWEVIVEPDIQDEVLVVITAYKPEF
jgi:hypothetical protein